VHRLVSGFLPVHGSVSQVHRFGGSLLRGEEGLTCPLQWVQSKLNCYQKLHHPKDHHLIPMPC